MEKIVSVKSDMDNSLTSKTCEPEINQKSENTQKEIIFNTFETLETKMSSDSPSKDRDIINLEKNMDKTINKLTHKELTLEVFNSLDTEKENLENRVQPENDNNRLCKVRKNCFIMDSDSEEELNLTENDKKSSQTVSKRKTPNVLNSDSENESSNSGVGLGNNETTLNNKLTGPLKTVKIHKRIAIVDTESESEDTEDILQNKSFNITVNKDTVIQHLIEPNTVSDSPSKDILDESQDISKEFCEPVTNLTKHEICKTAYVDSESENVKLNSTNCAFGISGNKQDELIHSNIQKSRLSMLCDSDSDEELECLNQQCSQELPDNEIIEQSQPAITTNTKSLLLNKNAKKGPIKNNKAKSKNQEIPQKMTPKEAAALRKEIQSESQRMTREKNVSLPYHKPKTHSLKEFLTRRPTLAISTLPANRAPPSVAIKMSMEQLQTISKQLEEREKEVKKFYESESESDNDDDADYKPPVSDSKSSKETTTCPQNQQDILEKENSIDNNSAADATNNLIDKQIQDGKETINEIRSSNLNNDALKEIGYWPDNSDAEQEEKVRDTSKEDKNSTIIDTETTGNLVDSRSVAEIDQSVRTESYDFHLDDENTEEVVTEDNMQTSKGNEHVVTESIHKSVEENTADTTKDLSSKPFIYSDLDKEIENFESTDNIKEIDSIENTVSPVIKSKVAFLKEKLANITPRLSGGPDEVIDLDNGISKPTEVDQLMERFAKHNASKKHHPKNKVKLSIVTVESGGDIHKETVAVNVDDDEADLQDEKPGRKLLRLKEELQKQMDKKKSKIWQEKAANGLKGNEQISEGDEDGEEIEEDILYDEEEEEEVGTTTDDDSEENVIENDVDLTDKPIKKCGFLDNEAEEEEEENEETLSGKTNDDKNGAEEKKQDGESESEDPKNDNDNSNISTDSVLFEPSEHENDVLVGKKRILKRILKPQDDSDDEDLFSNGIEKPMANEQLDSTVTADEDDIPPHQPRQLQTPVRQAVSQTKSISDFLTPISFITSIQNLTSATKSNKCGLVSPFRMPPDQSPSKEERSGVPSKKLFTNSDVMDSQASLNTQITQTHQSTSDLGLDNEIISQEELNDEPPSTQDLLGICSGEFTGVTQLEPSDENRKVFDFDGTQSSELKSLGTDQDMVISQLLDEEELENFKKKFESPVNPGFQQNSESQEITGGGIIDSDNEDEEGLEVKKKKNQRKIQFSDDDSSDEENDNDGEEIALQDKDEDLDNIDYDSEENEIDFTDKEPKQKAKLTDFFDEEAELSESEWGSEDEDEKDLDKLEFELGDTDKFDEEQVKADLEKIHMRRMLDDDAREVKLLQEVYLEDGEMHGTGRQRQFKWKNIDLTDNTPEDKNDDAEIYLDEEESEEQWRKRRHEREMFLKEKQNKIQNLDLEADLSNQSQLLKIGQKVLQRSQNNSQTNTPADKSSREPCSPISKTLNSFLSKRGSFLSRSDKVLQRVAEYTKVSTDISVNFTKTTKNFLFQSISTSEATVLSAEGKKRKASDGTPKVLKKLRLDKTLSPALKKTLPSERSKKLFNF